MMKRVAVLVALVMAAAACTVNVPHVGPASSGPIPATAAPSRLVPAGCRAALEALGEPGRSVLHVADVDLGYWAVEGNPPAEVANTLHALRFSATALGVDCSGAVAP